MIKTFNEDKIGCKGIENKSFKQLFYLHTSLNTGFFLYLQSSPTGPAEHCAGGSRPKSVNSFKKEKNYKSICVLSPDPRFYNASINLVAGPLKSLNN